MKDLITSSSNPTLKLARSLKQKKARDETGLFFVEGILHVGEALSAGWEIKTLISSPEILTSEFGSAVIDEMQKKGIRYLEVSKSAFETITEKDNPPGIAAIVKKKTSHLSDFSSHNFSVALVSPQDPGNVGTILRTIDSAGADGLILIDGGVEPYHPSCARASMGTIFWVPFYSASFEEFVSWSKNGNIRIIGTSAHAKTDFRNLQANDRPSILLMGSEQKGLLKEQIDICDDLVFIPMRGHASSLNLAVATGILLYGMKG